MKLYIYVGVDEDECDENGCSNGGICVARGTFAMRECFMSGSCMRGFHNENRHIQYVCIRITSRLQRQTQL